MSPYLKASGAFLTFLLVAGVVLAFERTSSFQMGYPGTGMDLVATNKELEARVKANTVPPSLPPASAEGQRAVDAYKNVQVLGHLSSGDFTRLMTAITTWVAPDQGCSYCHAAVKDANGNPEKDEDGYIVVDTNNLHSDELYTKRVARRMLHVPSRQPGAPVHLVQRPDRGAQADDGRQRHAEPPRRHRRSGVVAREPV